MRLNSYFWSLLGFSFLFSLSSLAKPSVDIELTCDLKIWARGPTCEVLSAQLNAIALWRTRLGEEQVVLKSECSCHGSQCKTEITPYLPKFAKKILGYAPLNDGPNCWNQALVSSGILPNLRGTEAQEFSYWMNSPLCQALPAGAQPEPGDVMAIRSDQGLTEQHAFIFVTPELSFSKKNFEAAESYRMLSVSEIEGRPYNLKPECKSISAAGCEMRVDAYRCQSLSQFEAQHPPSAKVIELRTLLGQNELQLEKKLFFTVDHFQKTTRGRAEESLAMIEAQLLVAHSEVDDLILKGLRLRDLSIISAMKLLP